MKTLPSERRIYRDPLSGASVTQWTRSSAKDNHLYFTSQSVTADDRWLVFLSERLGDVNLFAADRANEGVIRQISDNRSGLMRSYCWAGARSGLSKASPVLDHHHNRVYYIQDETLFHVNLDTPGEKPTALWQLPDGWWTAFNHVSPDGRWLCVPLAPPEVFTEELKNQHEQLEYVPVAFERTGLTSRIYMIDTATGEAHVAAERPEGSLRPENGTVPWPSSTRSKSTVMAM